MARPASASPASAELGARIRERRKELGLSQFKLAERMGVYPSVVSELERGRTDIRLSTLLRVAAALLVDTAWLIDGLEPPPR